VKHACQDCGGETKSKHKRCRKCYKKRQQKEAASKNRLNNEDKLLDQLMQVKSAVYDLRKIAANIHNNVHDLKSERMVQWIQDNDDEFEELEQEIKPQQKQRRTVAYWSLELVLMVLIATIFYKYGVFTDAIATIKSLIGI